VACHGGRPWMTIKHHFLWLFSGAASLVVTGAVCCCVQKPAQAAGQDALSRQIAESDENFASPTNEGQLVHLTGTISAGSPASDLTYAVSGKSFLRLRRTVEMYQWLEACADKLEGGGCSYRLGWSDHWRSSATFRHPEGHLNPLMPMKAKTFDGTDLKIGAYNLDDCLLDKISDFRPLPVTVLPSHPRHPSPFYPARPEQMTKGRIYIGWDPIHPHLGDVRISYEVVSSGTFSIVGRQSGNLLTCALDSTRQLR
jgi:hypothetical protein